MNDEPGGFVAFMTLLIIPFYVVGVLWLVDYFLDPRIEINENGTVYELKFRGD